MEACPWEVSRGAVERLLSQSVDNGKRGGIGSLGGRSMYFESCVSVGGMM